MFSLLIHDLTQEKGLTTGQKYGGTGYRSGIYCLVIVFALLALGSQRMSEFSVDLPFFLLLHHLRESSSFRHKGVKSICFRTALRNRSTLKKSLEGWLL